MKKPADRTKRTTRWYSSYFVSKNHQSIKTEKLFRLTDHMGLSTIILFVVLTSLVANCTGRLAG